MGVVKTKLTRYDDENTAGVRKRNNGHGQSDSCMKTKFSEVLIGYSKVAAFVNLDDGVAVFRKFGDLHARALLMRQAELEKLEKTLTSIDLEESWNYTENQQFPIGNRTFKQDKNADRTIVMEKISKALKLYGEELFSYKEMLALPKAKNWQRQYYQDWLREDRPIIYDEAQYLEDIDDLVSLRKETNENIELPERLSLFMRKIFRPFARLFETKKTIIDDPRIKVFSKSRKLGLNKLLFSIVTAAVLTIGVIVLTFVRTPHHRLVALCCLTLACPIFLGIFTTAKNSEIFEASAAYCAVLIVFVGSNTYTN